MWKSVLIAWLVLAIILLAGCSGGTSGSIVGARESCRINGGVGFCEGRFKRLNGTYAMDVEDEFIFGGDTIDVTVAASLGSGIIRISVEAPSGEITSLDITPDSPGTLVGVAEGEFDGFEITFEALDGEATEVEYRIDYQSR